MSMKPEPSGHGLSAYVHMQQPNPLVNTTAHTMPGTDPLACTVEKQRVNPCENSFVVAHQGATPSMGEEP